MLYFPYTEAIVKKVVKKCLMKSICTEAKKKSKEVCDFLIFHLILHKMKNETNRLTIKIDNKNLMVCILRHTSLVRRTTLNNIRRLKQYSQQLDQRFSLVLMMTEYLLT